MAVLHQAELTPPKIDLVASWLKQMPWAAGLGKPELIGSYRLDDPEGEVGIEFLLAACGEQKVHLPLTYRAAPMEGADEYLIGTTQHSVLGKRHVYDGCADPVLVHQLLTTVLTGGEQAEMVVEDNGEVVEKRVPKVLAKGDGDAALSAVPSLQQLGPVSLSREGSQTRVTVYGYEITVAHLLGDAPVGGDKTLLVSWIDGQAVAVGVTGVTPGS